MYAQAAVACYAAQHVARARGYRRLRAGGITSVARQVKVVQPEMVARRACTGIEWIESVAAAMKRQAAFSAAEYAVLTGGRGWPAVVRGAYDDNAVRHGRLYARI